MKLYQETKLPKDEADARIAKLATQALVQYRIERKQAEIEAAQESEELSAADAQEALQTVLIDSVAHQAEQMHRHNKFNDKDAPATIAALSASLSEVVAPYLKQLEQSGQWSRETAEETLTLAAARYADELREEAERGKKDTEKAALLAEADAVQASLLSQYRGENYQTVERNPLVETLLAERPRKGAREGHGQVGPVGLLRAQSLAGVDR